VGDFALTEDVMGIDDFIVFEVLSALEILVGTVAFGIVVSSETIFAFIIGVAAVSVAPVPISINAG
jgi:hypothetical protein